jgi:branched-chain amino acid transport system substrate-binding protein
MNPTAIKRASENGYPMDHFIGVWWSGSDDDARGGGKAAKGYLALNFSGLGDKYKAIQDIKKFVVDKGKSQVEKDKFADTFYNRGVYNTAIVAEAIRNAQKLSGKKVVTGVDVRRGLETLHITAARWKELGFENFAAPLTGVSCSDHSGHQPAYMQQWDGTKWVKVSDWIEPMKDKVGPMLDAAAKEYVEKNTGWPKRTEACDKAS